MARYARLYLRFLQFSFAKALQFRLDFFFRVLMDAVWYAMHLAFFAVLYGHTATLGGWTRQQAFVFIAGVFVADGIYMTVFSNNMWWFPFFVNRGDLDYYLVRPVSSLWFVSLRDFAANSFLNLLLAFGVLGWALASYGGPLPLDRVLVYAVLLLLGVFIYYAIHMVFLIPVFWLHTAHGLREIYFSLSIFAHRPHGIFTGWMRRVLTSILPFALVVSFPTRALFEGVTTGLVVHMAAVSAGLLVVLVWLWRRGLRAYASASS
jgi:viologen exporter family transport system permease protein